MQFHQFPPLLHGRVLTGRKERLPEQPNATNWQEFMGRLVKAVEGATFAGCIHPVLTMQFGPSVFLGGRIYSRGVDSFQNMKAAERSRITINGEPAVEIDMKASSLSIFLALVQSPEPEGGDPYQCGPLAGLDREAVKPWFVSSLQGGSLRLKWSPDTPESARQAPLQGDQGSRFRLLSGPDGPAQHLARECPPGAS
ncbi:hypothetical protein [Gluconacetobacter johannae]|uniref:Uncharacterized protein n=1 Tax=Gluconacetobacter johannae TaxID=112140 RepID=A0A7W4J7R7_9PROT|nr:hypothetical protein [Gluconacetobacter johannae]MBB2176179.1 hypothetical protein [Gluconacetobacter johannae]